MGKAESDVKIPALAQVLDRIVRQGSLRLLVYVEGDRLACHLVEQSLHVAEVLINRGGLHPGGGTHRPCGHRGATAGCEQLGGGAEDTNSSVGPRHYRELPLAEG